jgi:hypothetical protein
VASTEVTSCRYCRTSLWITDKDGSWSWWTADESSVYCPKAPPADPGKPVPHYPVALMNELDRAVYEELERRRAARELASRMAVRGMWHEGTCVGCGLSDLPVIGLPGSEHCRYCEELRALPKPPEVIETHRAEVIRRGRPPVLVLAGCLLLISYAVSGIEDLALIGMVLLGLSCIIQWLPAATSARCRSGTARYRLAARMLPAGIT